ncbi:MAG TPA: UvrD-helicase domain-containing protein [Pirellulales bacterium]|nr:UvrD-helicase domain-containing protein [Pirellulales bacterium]
MIRIAENSFPHTLIRASAGTGKTFQLSNRYLGLALAGVAPDEILATTFTRKAAAEILERVLIRLAEAADDPREAARLGGFLGRELTNDEAAHVLEAFVHHLHRLHISTLDSFFAQIARSFDLELGLPPGWRIVEESVDGQLKNEAIQAVLAERDPQEGDLPHEPAPFTLTLLHLLTKGEATRTVGQQLRSLVNGLHGLYLETAPEAWDRLPRPPRLTDDKLALAIEALESAVLPGDKRFASARDKDLAAARAGKWDDFIDGGIAGQVVSGEATYYGKQIDNGLAEIYRPLVRHAKGVLVSQLADQTHATWQFLEKFDAHYRRLKLAKRALRFDDVTRALARSGLSERPTRLAFRLDAQIDHVLLDEFQDTSLTQWSVLRPLVRAVIARGDAAEADQSASRPGNRTGSFFCVGDVKQAIYGWRGGVAELFDALGADWPDLRQPTLTESRRSATPIIETVNRVFDGLAANPAMKKSAAAAAAWRRGFEMHTTAQRQLAGYARMVTAPLAGDDQETVTLRFAAGQIERLVAEAPGRSVGVLVRDNDAVATLIDQLRRAKVSSSEEGGNPLTDSPAVMVVLSLLTLADHPGDKAARFHVASSPLGAALGYADHQDDLASHRLSLEVRRQLLAQGYGPTIYPWARVLAEACDARDASRLLQLVELAYRFEAEAGLRTRDFVSFVEHERVEAPSPADVRVMTIHQAKGLQFDIVVLPQLEVRLSGQNPPVVVGRPEATAPASLVCRYANESLRRMLPDEVRQAFERSAAQTIRESLCVLYVALTRAVHALHLIVAPSKESENQTPGLVSGVLRAALTDGQPLSPETVVYEHGDRLWFRQDLKTGPKTSPAAHLEQAWPKKSSFRVALAPATKRRRVLERESPSELAHRAQVDLALRMGLESSRAVNRGTAFHAWFEQIEWLDDGGPEPGELRSVGLRTGATEREVEEWLRQFRAKLENPRLRAALSRAAYQSARDAPWASRPEISAELGGAPPMLEVFRERPFAVRLRDTLLSGTFDRLLLIRSSATRRLVAAEVLDYKTDAVAAGDPQAVGNIVDRYRPQLSAYREAVCRMFGLPNKRVMTRLAVIEAGEVLEVA